MSTPASSSLVRVSIGTGCPYFIRYSARWRCIVISGCAIEILSLAMVQPLKLVILIGVFTSAASDLKVNLQSPPQIGLLTLVSRNNSVTHRCRCLQSVQLKNHHLFSAHTHALLNILSHRIHPILTSHSQGI